MSQADWTIHLGGPITARKEETLFAKGLVKSIVSGGSFAVDDTTPVDVAVASTASFPSSSMRLSLDDVGTPVDATATGKDATQLKGVLLVAPGSKTLTANQTVRQENGCILMPTEETAMSRADSTLDGFVEFRIQRETIVGADEILWGGVLRLIDVNNFYLAGVTLVDTAGPGIYNIDDIVIFKRIAGVWTQLLLLAVNRLDLNTSVFSNGLKVTAQIKGGLISVAVEGQVLGSVTDGSLALAGRFGLGSHRVSAAQAPTPALFNYVNIGNA